MQGSLVDQLMWTPQVYTAQGIHSLHNEGPALQESRSTHQRQAQGVAAASV